MRVSHPVLFVKFTALAVSLVTIVPVLLFVVLPFWAHSLLFLAFAVALISYLLEAVDTDRRNGGKL